MSLDARRHAFGVSRASASAPKSTWKAGVRLGGRAYADRYPRAGASFARIKAAPSLADGDIAAVLAPSVRSEFGAALRRVSDHRSICATPCGLCPDRARTRGHRSKHPRLKGPPPVDNRNGRQHARRLRTAPGRRSRGVRFRYRAGLSRPALARSQCDDPAPRLTGLRRSCKRPSAGATARLVAIA